MVATMQPDEPDSTQPTRVSLRDVAKRLDISHATVSMALRNHPKVAKKTREHVQKKAKQMGYVPDAALRALAEYRRNKTGAKYQATLAWVNNWDRLEDLEKHRDFRLYREGAEERANALGYKLEVISPVQEGLSSKKLRKVFRARSIQGLLLPPQPEWGKRWDFDFSDFSAVSFGFSLHSPHLHTIANHQFQSCALAVKKLRDLGHERIGFIINKSLNERSERSFLGGYLAEQHSILKKNQIPPEIMNIRPKETDFVKLQKWVKKYKPDGIITDMTEILPSIEAIGWSVPRDMSVALLAVRGESNQWSGINQQPKEIGRVAMDTLAGMLYQNETGVPKSPLLIFVEGVWRSGESVICRNDLL